MRAVQCSGVAHAAHPHVARPACPAWPGLPDNTLPLKSRRCLQLRVFVAAPAPGGYRQELNQSPVLFRESSVSPDQEERIRRKDAIIQTRNAQVGQGVGWGRGLGSRR